MKNVKIKKTMLLQERQIGIAPISTSQYISP